MGINLTALKAQPILKEINGIEIYNINSKVNTDRKEAIYKYVIETLQNSVGKDFELLGKEVIVNVLPLLTNILLDELSDAEIQEIIEEPADDLLETIKYINKIITDILENLNNLMNLPQEQLEKFVPKKTKKELLLEQMKEEEKKRKAEWEAKLAEAEEDNVVESYDNVNDFEDVKEMIKHIKGVK